MGAFNQNFVLSGLTSIVTSIPIAGTYICSFKTTLPTVTDGGGQSSVVMTITQNSTAVLTSAAGAQGGSVVVNCAAGDTITCANTSAAAADQGLNVIKSIISIG